MKQSFLSRLSALVSRAAGLVILSLVLSVILLGCEAESDPDRVSNSSCPAVGDLTVETSSSLSTSGRCLISGTLTVNATLPASESWYINGSVTIGNASSSPIFTIEAGTQIFGDSDGSSFDYLYLSPGASLNATGTINDPIIFSSDDSDYEGRGEWGGLILEDTTATFGQIVLQYVIVTEAGGEVSIGSNTYADNIVLEGIHDNTRIQFFQSHDSARDGIRVQSSEASASEARLGWVLITGASRDGFSYDNFSGLVKDMLVIHRPGIYNSISGGRAGIYGSDANSNPLFVNVTLAGRDTTSQNAANTAQREFGIVFADGITQFRMANTVVSNFRNGCYEIDASSQLSGIVFSASDLTASFIDGVHCGHENSGLAGNVFVPFLVRSGDDTDNIPDSVRGDNNGDGFRFYGNRAFNFEGEFLDSAITSNWYLNSIDGIDNDLVEFTSNTLNAFADGDTNADGSIDRPPNIYDSTDKDSQPLRASVDGFFGSVNGVGGDSQGYDLTIIGAIRSSNSNFASEFDGWTLQAGGVFPQEVTGFDP